MQDIDHPAIADANRAIPGEAAEAFKARVHVFRLRDPAGTGQSGFARNIPPDGNTPVAVTRQPEGTKRAAVNVSAAFAVHNRHPSMPENAGRPQPRAALSEIWAVAMATAGKRQREPQGPQESHERLHPTPGHQEQRHRGDPQPGMGRPRSHNKPLGDGAPDPYHDQLASYRQETLVPNSHGFYQIALPHQLFHRFTPVQQMFQTDARGNDHAVRIRVPNARDEAGQHHHTNSSNDDLDQPRRPTPTRWETTDILPLLPPLAPADSASNRPCQSDTPYLSEVECARNYALAKHHLVRGWQSLYPGATVPESQSNIPALQVRIERMRQWAGYDAAVRSAERHLEEALELLQACEPGKVVRISGGVGRGDWREGIRRWAVGVGREAAWEEGVDGGERWMTQGEMLEEWKREEGKGTNQPRGPATDTD